MKFLFCWCLLCWCSLVAVQSQPSLVTHEDVRQIIPQLLNSQVEKDQAWAAWLAGKYRLEEFAPALIKLLLAGPSEDSQINDWRTRAVLDALIQLQAAVPAERLQALPERFRDETIILLALASVKSQTALLTLLEQRLTDEQWLAVGNLLTELRAPGWAVSLLRELEIQASIHVVENENMGWVSGGGWGGGGVGDGVAQVPPGFPPVVFYQLEAWPRQGNVLIARGRHPVYYQRKESKPDAHGQIGINHSHTSNNRNRYRVEYVMDLLGVTRETLNFPETPSFSIVWKSPLAFQLEGVRLRQQLQQSWLRVVAQLQQRELLTKEEAATLVPKIVFKVYDHRTTQTNKLPEL